MARRTPRDRKLEALEQNGTVNPSSEQVRDELFLQQDFFDARDLVQVKYELLRRVRTDGLSVTDAVARFGVSRPTFYKVLADFYRAGLPALLPRKRGPKGPHKVTTEILAFVESELAEHADLDAATLAERVAARFKRSIHPRTIQRALAWRKKKPI
jgi:transposase